MVNWTDEQMTAIRARNSNLLVTAAAGSGKTAVLVQRVIELVIEDQVDIDKLLIVTFTRAAAAEMKNRIRKALMEKLELTRGKDAGLLRQINLLNKAQISTLHSFCQTIVRDHFHLAEVDPGFQIGEENEMMLLKNEAAEETMDREYEIGREMFYELLEMFSGGRDDTKLKEIIISIYDFIQSKPEPYGWLKNMVAQLALTADEFDRSFWNESLADQAVIQINAAMEMLSRAVNIAGRSSGPAHYLPVLEEDCEKVRALHDTLQISLRGYIEALSSIQFRTLPSRGECDPDLRERAKAYRNGAKDIIKKARESFMGKKAEDLAADLNQMYPAMACLEQMVSAFHERYQQLKTEKGVLDFNDLEHYALKILAHDPVAEEYRQRFAYVFVDEYQDSNQIQEAIIQRVKKADNLFMVGDVKQSIYRFRLADPTLFMDKYRDYRDGENEPDRRICLHSNFRSQAAILHGVNFVFKNIMSPALGEIEYDESACLYPGRQDCNEAGSGEKIEMIIIDHQDEVDENGTVINDELEELNKIQIEAYIVADKIKALLNTRVYDPQLGKERNAAYKDMVILLRTTRNWIDVFTEVFNAEGIPSYADINSGYLDALEISLFLNLLKVIDNPRQDIELISVLRSPIFQFSIEELASIRLASNEKTFYAALMDYPESGELHDKISGFSDNLHKWQKMARYLPLEELIRELMLDSGYLYYVTAMPGGMQRVANIRLLFTRARNFQNSTMHGLFSFLKYMEQVKASQADIGTAKTLGENDNVVRLMSVHKSKGLEFPIVILAGMGKYFNMTDTNQNILLHKDLGIGPRLIDTERRTISQTIAHNVIKEKIRLENLSEEMRVFYVACTRAQEKMIMTGSVANIGKAVNKWSNTIDTYHLAQARCGLDWFGPVIMRHRDGSHLRALLETEWEEGIWPDESCWDISIVNKNKVRLGLLQSSREKKALLQQLVDFQPLPDSPWKETVKTRLNWVYPYTSAGQIPAKLSVTQIQKLKDKNLSNVELNIPALISQPKFRETKPAISALEKGNAMHFILQHLDLKQVQSREQIQNQLDLMTARQLLSAEEAAAVEIESLMNFYQSDIGRRVLAADTVKRETPFNLLCPASEVIEGAETAPDEELLVQGIIDLYFTEGDDIVLVDYKTDYITPENRSSKIDAYRVQIELYKRALESILKKRVKESYLYFLSINEPILMDVE